MDSFDFQEINLDPMRIKISPTTFQLIDDLHQEEIECLQCFVKVLAKGDPEEISKWLEKLIDHAERHFHEEELHMIRVHYPGLDAHWHAHAQEIRRMREAQVQWEDEQDVVDLWSFLNHQYLTWFEKHTRRFDLPAAEFIRQFDKAADA